MYIDLDLETMTRRYSHCNGNGQTSRSGGSGGGGLRLFGVRLTDGSFIKKSASMGSLSHQHSPTENSPDGYHSDDIDDGFTARRRPLRKKGFLLLIGPFSFTNLIGKGRNWMWELCD